MKSISYKKDVYILEDRYKMFSIKDNGDFKRLYRQGRKKGSKYIVVYVKENKLTVKNVDNKLTSSQANISYKPNIMCKKTIAKGVTEYVVDGKEITQNKGDKIGSKYYKVTLYEEELTFSIKPITKKVYGGECNG